MRIRRHLRSNVVGYVALFVALSATAWAASELSRNEVKSRHIKNGAVKKRDLGKNAVTSPKVANGSLLKEDFASDQLPQDPLFAYIRDDTAAVTANVQYGSGVTAVDDPAGNGGYHVTFNRSLVGCVVHAAPGFGDPRAGGNAFPRSTPFVSVGGADDRMVFVEFTDLDMNATVDTSFLITAFC
jgi:hypothetical protein